jgi:hypothetical protein
MPAVTGAPLTYEFALEGAASKLRDDDGAGGPRHDSVARVGGPQRVLENRDINAIGE